jgi:hypothetical protein
MEAAHHRTQSACLVRYRRSYCYKRAIVIFFHLSQVSQGGFFHIHTFRNKKNPFLKNHVKAHSGIWRHRQAGKCLIHSSSQQADALFNIDTARREVQLSTLS